MPDNHTQQRVYHYRSSAITNSEIEKPNANNLDFGEIAINYNAQEPSLFIKQNDSEIAQFVDKKYIEDNINSLIGNGALTIQKNGTNVGSFSANQTTNKTINIVVPTTASDVNALPDSTKYAASLSLDINSSTYVVTAQLKDQEGNNLGTQQTIDLPLETMVVSGSYISSAKTVSLVLQNGNKIEFSVADLVSGLQTEITDSNKLSADLIENGNTNKVFTSSEKTKLSNLASSLATTSASGYMSSTQVTKLNGIESGAEVNVQPDWNETNSGSDAYILNKPTKLSQLTNDSGFITSAVTSLKNYATSANVVSELDKKVETFECEFTMTMDSSSQEEFPYNCTITCDKTVNEISSAAANGKKILAKCDISNMFAELSGVQYISYWEITNNMYNGENAYVGFDVDMVLFGEIHFSVFGNGEDNLWELGVAVNSNDLDRVHNLQPVAWYGTIGYLNDVAIYNSPSSGQILQYNGTNWVNETLPSMPDVSNFITSAVTDLQFFATSSATVGALNNKVDKVSGKGLSTNDYTNDEKNKLAGIESGAQVNVQSDWGQNNSASTDYIKNRTHYREYVEGDDIRTVFNANFSEFNDGDFYRGIIHSNKPDIKLNSFYDVVLTINNVDYIYDNIVSRQDGNDVVLTYNCYSYDGNNWDKFKFGVDTNDSGLYLLLSTSAYSLTGDNVSVGVNIKELVIGGSLYDFNESGLISIVEDLWSGLTGVYYMTTTSFDPSDDYKIKIDNVEYTREVQYTDAYEGIPIYAFGNGKFLNALSEGEVDFGLPDNGDNFCIAFIDGTNLGAPSNVVYMILRNANYASSASSTTVKVYKYGAYEYHKLDNRYLDLENSNAFAKVAFSGDYSDLENTPYIPESLDNLTDISFGYITSGQILQYNGSEWVNAAPPQNGTLTTTATTALSTATNESLNSSVSLHKVAKTGTYSDLVGKPTKLSDFTNDGVFIDSGVTAMTYYATSANVVTALSGKTNQTINVTYAQLVQLINNSSLIPGQSYRITDYTTTTALSGTSAAGRDFDLIVFATETNKLDCKAKAITRPNTNYDLGNLSKWEIWYDISNDSYKYDWAYSGGKGVIYRMIDENFNDCPYDFKNIKFTISGIGDTYTFQKNSNDASRFSDYCHDNIIRPRRSVSVGSNGYTLRLNFNVFITDNGYCTHNFIDYNCYYNIFSGGSQYNIFGEFCRNNYTCVGFNNTLGSNCEGNNITYSDFNILGSLCSNNNFEHSDYNSFSTNCSGNILETSHKNSFGNECCNNYLSEYCDYNEFGNSCKNNYFYLHFSHNKIGNGCYNISFNSDKLSQCGYMSYNIVECGNKNISMFGGIYGNSNNQIQNVYIAQGVNSSASTLSLELLQRNLPYRTTVARNSNGVLKIYNEADLVL